MAAEHVTPSSLPTERVCKSIEIPNTREWLGIFDKLLLAGADSWKWQQLPDGAVTVEETIAFWQTVLAAFWDNPACATGSDLIPTPFWDDVTDTDDEATPALQPWYGYVTNPDLPADELTFVEDAAIWAFTGLLAVSGTPAAAILFHTTAPSFVLAMRGDDLGEVIRVVLDAEDAAEVTTTGDPDELVELSLYPDPSLSTHDILVILREVL
jgi:hypothetical protein